MSKSVDKNFWQFLAFYFMDHINDNNVWVVKVFIPACNYYSLATLKRPWPVRICVNTNIESKVVFTIGK